MPVFSQSGNTALYKGIRAQTHYGFIFAHSQSVQNTSGAHPLGVEVELIRQRIDTATWDVCHCYPIKGWSFSYFNFDSKILGHGLPAPSFFSRLIKLAERHNLLFGEV